MGAKISLRVQKHRASLRASGLRLVQIWLPDRRREGFTEECRRQSISLRKDPHEKKILEELANIADTERWFCR